MIPKRYRVLIVDDEPLVRRVLRERLSAGGYRCDEAGNGEEALERLAKDTADLVLLDIRMPRKSGVEVLPMIKSDYPDTAIIMISAVIDADIAIQCMKAGAYDYLIKPLTLDEVVLSAERVLERRNLQIENRAYQEHLEEMVVERTKELKQAMDRIKLASLDTIHRLARAAEYKDEDTGAHIKRIGWYSTSIAREMGLSYSEVENMAYAAPMHDVGKIGIPDRILLKPGDLGPKEWEIMKEHTTIGAQILHGADAEFIRMAEIIALTHHERWDGSGYPKGLRGSDIPLAGRIVAISDVFDALASKRHYKDAYPIEESFEIIKESRGTHFDPDVVDAFFGSKRAIIAITRKHVDDEKMDLARSYSRSYDFLR
jgi:putative two-component system response regulator